MPDFDGLNAYPIGMTHDGRLVARTFRGEEPSVLWVGNPIP